MRLPDRVCLVALALVLVQLAAVADEIQSAYELATPCCESLSELRYEQLPVDRPALFEIDAKSQMFVFDTGRSFVLAVELPEREPPYTVQVRSYAVGDVIQRSRLFYPAALLLDADHRVLEFREPADLPVVKTSFGDARRENHWGLPLRLEWDVLIDRPGTKYLVIHPTESRLASRSFTTTRRAVPVILPGLVTALPGKKEEVGIAHSPFGRLALQVMP